MAKLTIVLIKINKNEFKLLSLDIKKFQEKKMWVFAHLGLLDFSQGKKDPHVYPWPVNDFRFYSGFERPEKGGIWEKSKCNILP